MVLEWYPWSTFSEIEEIGKGGFATVFRAITKVERINYISDEYVALKTIGHYQSLSKDFLNEVTNLNLLFIIFVVINLCLLY